MSHSAIWFLENINLPDILCPSKQLQYSPNSNAYRAGDYISIPRDRANQIFFLNSGKIKIGSINSEGKEITTVILRSGEVFGLRPEGQGKAFIACITDCKISSVSVEEMKALYRNDNVLKRFLMKTFGSKRLATQARLESILFRDSWSRIALVLTEMGKRKGREQSSKALLIKDGMNAQLLAERSANSRQTVIKGLNRFRKENLIAFNEKNLLIKDMDKLEKYAQGNEKVG